MSDHRPTHANEKDDEARLLLAAARDRLNVAAADLSLADALRLTEWQRATASAVLEKLVRTVEDELRASLVEEPAVKAHEALHGALSSAHVAIAGPILDRSGLHIDRPLVAAAIRRSEEHRRFRASTSGESALLVEMIGDSDAHVAELAMAIVIAQSRRLDRFSEPTAARTELPAEVEYRLAWRVAAALRQYMVDRHALPPAAADHVIVAAAERLLSRYDEGDSLEAKSMRLARRLHEIGRLSDDLAARALSEGMLPLFVACLAVRTSLGHAAAWEVLSDPRGRGVVLLLKAAEIERAQAASILLGLGGAEEAVAAQLDLFDVTDSPTARESLRLWQVDPGYRDAICELAA